MRAKEPGIDQRTERWKEGDTIQCIRASLTAVDSVGVLKGRGRGGAKREGTDANLKKHKPYPLHPFTPSPRNPDTRKPQNP